MVQEPTLLFKYLKTKSKKISNTSTLSYTLDCRNKQWAGKVDLKAPKKISEQNKLSDICPVKTVLLHIHLITSCLYVKAFSIIWVNPHNNLWDRLLAHSILRA